MNRILVTIGPITIYWYSAIMLIAVIVGIALAVKESKKHAMESFISDLIIKIIVYGIIGARLYYVIFNFDSYKANLLSILKIWEGGLAIYGAIIGGLIAITTMAIKREKSIIDATDIVTPGLILSQAIGRWGNFFNGEAHGPEVTLNFLEKLHLPKFIIEGMHINGTYYHPTFLYESLWCLLGFIILIILRNKTKRKKGIMTFGYFIWYGFGRFFIEILRTDSLFAGDYKISQIVSIVLVIIGIVGIIVSFVKGNKDEKQI